MKTILLTLLLSLSSISYALAQTKTILDFRSDYNDKTDNLAKLLPATERQVIAKVVRKTDKACSGTLQPTVIDYATGSFTTPSSKQVAYLVDLGDSCHPRTEGTIRLAIASGKNITAYGDVTGYQHIRQITDINADGVNEILLEAGWLGHGYFYKLCKTCGNQI